MNRSSSQAELALEPECPRDCLGGERLGDHFCAFQDDGSQRTKVSSGNRSWYSIDQVDVSSSSSRRLAGSSQEFGGSTQ